MYWHKQEQVAFEIILFILVTFQIATFFTLKNYKTTLPNGIFLVGLNCVFFIAMIPYAKWVWKTTSHQKALFLVTKHEIIFLGLNVAIIILTMQMI